MKRQHLHLTPVAVVLLAASLPANTVCQQVAEVQVAPVAVTMSVGERKEIMADAYDGRGDIVPAARFAWSTSDPGVVEIEEDPSLPGIVALIGLGEGVANVEVRVGNQQASATVQVVGMGGAAGGAVGGGVATVLQIDPPAIFLLPSEEIRPQPRFLNDNGDLAAPTSVTWRFLGQDGVAEVRQQGGVVGLSPGQGVLEATTPTGLLARVTVQVAQAEFAFQSTHMGLSPNMSDTVEVTVPDQNDRRLQPNWLAWRSTDMSVVHVSPLGMVTGRSAGQAEIIASGFGHERTLHVTVHRPVEFLEAMPPYSEGPVAVPLSGSRTFTATALAADETPVPEAPLRWTLADTTLASFDHSTGTLTGDQLGRTTLTVSGPGEGLEVVWNIEVVAEGLDIHPDVISVVRGEPTRLSASFTDDAGTPVADATNLSWTSSPPEVLSVDGEGTLTAAELGSAQVVANTPWGSTDTATVYVIGEILITSTRAENVNLYSFDRDQPEAFYQVTDEPGSELSATYSPDGTKIAYISDRGGNLDVYVANPDGSNAEKITSTESLEGSPTWTPDGTRIVFESDQSGSSQIWIMNADGTEQMQLTTGETAAFRPAVSPDGNRVLFASSSDDNYDICVVDIDGTNRESLTQTRRNEMVPTWMNDSTIAFIRQEGRGRNMTRMIYQMELTSAREVTPLFTQALTVTDFAVSAEGDLIAATVSAQGPAGVENRLYLIPLTPGSVPMEVPRADAGDQLVAPSFRRR